MFHGDGHCVCFFCSTKKVVISAGCTRIILGIDYKCECDGVYQQLMWKTYLLFVGIFVLHRIWYNEASKCFSSLFLEDYYKTIDNQSV